MMRTLSVLVCLAALAPTAAACKKAADGPGAASAVRVTDLEIGRSLAADKAIADQTSEFRPTDTIYLSVVTDGSASQATLAARWTYQDGQVVKELSENIAPTGRSRTEFHIAKPDGWPVGKYSVAVSLNGAAAGTKDFEVK
jgi:adenine-specific DNA methylase